MELNNMMTTDVLQPCFHGFDSSRKEWSVEEGCVKVKSENFLPAYDIEFRQARMLARKDFQEQADQYEIFFAIKLNRTFFSTTVINADSTDSGEGCSEELSFAERYWGITRTSERLANFVMAGAEDDINKIRMGRNGVIQGFIETKEAWSGTLPEISYATLVKALEKIDMRLTDLIGSTVDIAA